MRRLLSVVLRMLPCLLAAGAAVAQEASPPPASPGNLVARDRPGDNGNAIDLQWQLSVDDRPDQKPRRVRGYRLDRTLLDPPAEGESATEQFEVPYGVNQYTDRRCRSGARYRYTITTLGTAGEVSLPAVESGEVQAVRQWFDTSRTGFAVILVVICGAVIYFTERTKAGKSLHVREIAALQAMQEAVGRATEMGRPCLFLTGIEDMNEIATVAGVAILSHVAQTAADYDAEIVVPTTRSLVMTAAQEAVSAAYLAADRADSYNPANIYYVTDEQFAFVAHVTGYMVRERPAACFYAGIFYAESLILAETGNSVGAIQIAGTSEATQLPFFVAGCDYTLIGEELFAASAYLTREPQQLGSLKGQDAGKVLAATVLIGGCLLKTATSLRPDWSTPAEWLNFLTTTCLGGG